LRKKQSRFEVFKKKLTLIKNKGVHEKLVIERPKIYHPKANPIIVKPQRQITQKEHVGANPIVPRLVDIKGLISKISHPKAKPTLSKEAKHTLVTMSTPFGFVSFRLGRAKKIILGLFATVATLFLVFGSAGLLFSVSVISELSELLDNTKKRYEEISAQNAGLKSVVDEAQKERDKLEKIGNMINLRSESDSGVPLNLSDVRDEQKMMMLRNIPSGSPVPYGGVTSQFGSRNHPVLGRSIFHEGTDFKATMGTKVYATADGIVEYVGRDTGYGNKLVIAHSYGFKSVYGHLSRFAARPGEFIKKGQLVAYSGNTGLTAGPHLHYEVRFIGEPLNPENFLHWSYSNFSYLFEKEKKVKWGSLVEVTKWQTPPARQ